MTLACPVTGPTSTKELAAIGKPASEIRGLILTHGDGDHIGFAERLRAEHGVPIYVHAEDAHRAMTGEKPKTPMGAMRLGPALGFMAYGVRKNGLRLKVRARGDGDRGRRRSRLFLDRP